MRLLFGSLLVLVLAAAIGLGATWMALSRNLAFGGITLGSWSAWPKSGTVEIDPYSRANLVRVGNLPVGTGDGIAFVARTDDAGTPFDGRCETVLSGITPAARFWTLTLYDKAGKLVPNSIGRYGFTSQEISRRSDGTFDIVIAPRVRAGNWLPTGGVESYQLMLRLYDTPIGVATRSAREAPMPAITQKACS